MKLSQWLNEERGRGLSLATVIGVSPVLISQWSTGLRVPPFERCIPIERATCGVVTRRDLRPDDYAVMWPELAEFKPISPEKSVNHAQTAIKTVAQGA